MRKIRSVFLIVLFLAFGAYVLIGYYPYIFSRKVIGEITAVEKILPGNTVIMGSGDPSPEIYSFAIGIRDGRSGEIVTASTEDRQWAVAKPGQCAEAQFFPYPPWNLNSWGTYYNARLLKLMDCAPK